MISVQPNDLTTTVQTSKDKELWKAAQAMEASFLSEMLKSTGFGESRGVFGGGAGEDHFSSFLRNEHAKQISAAGGIGLAQSIYDAIKENQIETV